MTEETLQAVQNSHQLMQFVWVDKKQENTVAQLLHMEPVQILPIL